MGAMTLQGAEVCFIFLLELMIIRISALSSSNMTIGRVYC